MKIQLTQQQRWSVARRQLIKYLIGIIDIDNWCIFADGIGTINEIVMSGSE